MRKWRCTVCNYIHEGAEPPEKCPVCGADKSKFVEIPEEEAKEVQSKKSQKQLDREKAMVENAKAAQEGKPEAQKPSAEPAKSQPAPTTFIDTFKDLLIKHHAHPISVHIPNGVLPVSVLFVLLAIWWSAGSLAQAAFYNSVVVLLSMPVVLYTGYNTWQRKFGGALTNIFIAKIASAGAVTVTCLLVVLWFLINPKIMEAGAARQAGFVLLNLIMMAAAVIAGLIGGKLALSLIHI